MDLLDVLNLSEEDTDQEEETPNTDRAETKSQCINDVDTVTQKGERPLEYKPSIENWNLNFFYDYFFNSPGAEFAGTLTRSNDDGRKITHDETNEILETHKSSETSPVENKVEVSDENKVINVETEQKTSLYNEPATLPKTKKHHKTVQIKSIVEILNEFKIGEPLSPIGEPLSPSDEEIAIIEPPPPLDNEPAGLAKTKKHHKTVQIKPIAEILNEFKIGEPLSPIGEPLSLFDEEIAIVEPPPVNEANFTQTNSMRNLTPLDKKLLERDEFRSCILYQPVVVLEELSQELLQKTVTPSSPPRCELENQAEHNVTIYDEHCRPGIKKLVVSKKTPKSTEQDSDFFCNVSDFQQEPGRIPRTQSEIGDSTIPKPTAIVTGRAAQTLEVTPHSRFSGLFKRETKKKRKGKVSKYVWQKPQNDIGRSTKDSSSTVSEFPYSAGLQLIPPSYFPNFKIKKVDSQTKSATSVDNESATRRRYLQQPPNPIEYVSPLQNIMVESKMCIKSNYHQMKEENGDRKNNSDDNRTTGKGEKLMIQNEKVAKFQDEVLDVLKNAPSSKQPVSSVIPNCDSNSLVTRWSPKQPDNDYTHNESSNSKRLVASSLVSGNVSINENAFGVASALLSSNDRQEVEEIVSDVDTPNLSSDFHSQRSTFENIPLVGRGPLENIGAGTLESVPSLPKKTFFPDPVIDQLKCAVTSKQPFSSVIPDHDSNLKVIALSPKKPDSDYTRDEGCNNKGLDTSLVTSSSASTNKDVFGREYASLTSNEGQEVETVLDVNTPQLSSDFNSRRGASENIPLVGSGPLEIIWDGTWETASRTPKKPVIDQIEIPPVCENTQIKVPNVSNISSVLTNYTGSTINKPSLLERPDLYSKLISNITEANLMDSSVSLSLKDHTVSRELISTEKSNVDNLISVIIQNLLDVKPLLCTESVKNLSINFSGGKQLSREDPISSNCSDLSKHGATNNQLTSDATDNNFNKQQFTPTVEYLSSSTNFCVNLKENEKPLSYTERSLSTNLNLCDQMGTETNIVLPPNPSKKCPSLEPYHVLQLVKVIAPEETFREILHYAEQMSTFFLPPDLFSGGQQHTHIQSASSTVALEKSKKSTAFGNLNILPLKHNTAPILSSPEVKTPENSSWFGKQQLSSINVCSSSSQNSSDQLHVNAKNNIKQLKDILMNFLMNPSSILQIDQERRYKTERLIEVLNEMENNYYNIPVSSYADIVAPIALFAKEILELSEPCNSSQPTGLL